MEGKLLFKSTAITSLKCTILCYKCTMFKFLFHNFKKLDNWFVHAQLSASPAHLSVQQAPLLARRPAPATYGMKTTGSLSRGFPNPGSLGRSPQGCSLFWGVSGSGVWPLHTRRYCLCVALETGCGLVTMLGRISGSAQHHDIPHHSHVFPATSDDHQKARYPLVIPT